MPILILLNMVNAAKQRLPVGPRDAWRGIIKETQNAVMSFIDNKGEPK